MVESFDIDAELDRGEQLLAQERYADAVSCARGVLARAVGDERALDLIDRAEQRAGGDLASLANGEWRVGDVIDDRWTVFGGARGGMGQVYFVRDRAWDNAELAVKSLFEPTHSTDAVRAQARARFRRETQVWLDLGSHPHIVSGYYTLEVQGRLRFFMEFVSGDTLLAMAQAGTLTVPRVLDLAIQLAGGLAYVHERGIAHRDLKPANCLVMADDTIRITDFGLGKTVDDIEAGIEVGPGAAANLSVYGAGTPAYMAPEQWGSLAAAGRPADLYALGVLLWELLAGRRPFEPSPRCWSRYASLPRAIARLIASDDPPADLVLPLMHAELPPLSLRDLGLMVPASLDELILACLAKAPDQRPTAGALRDELVEVHKQVTGHPPARPVPVAIAPAAAGDNNRALSYDMMGERAKAIAILDAALARDRTAPYPWLNRAAIAIEDGVQPCLFGARVASELLPTHADLHDDNALRPTLERLARYFHPCPPVTGLDTTFAIRVAGGRGVVTAFDATTGRVQATHEVRDIALGIACIGDVAAVSDGSAIRVVSATESTRTLSWLEGHRDLVTALAASADQRYLASASNDGSCAIWSLRRGTIIRRIRLRALACSVVWRQSREVIVTMTNGDVHAFGLADRSRDIVAREALCTTVGFDGTVIVGRRDGTIACHHAESRGASHLKAHDGAVIAIHAAAGLIASADEHGRIRVWGRDGVLAEAPAIPGRIRALRIAANGSHIAIGSEAGGVHVWSLTSTGAWPRTIQRDVPALEKRRRAREVLDLADRLAAGDPAALVEADRMRVHQMELGRDPALLAARHHLITAGGLASGPHELYSLWNARLPDSAIAMAVAPDGRLAVSTRDSIAILHGGTGAVIAQLPVRAAVSLGFDGAELFAANDGGDLISLDPDGTVRWRARWTSQLRAAACAAGVVAAGGMSGSWAAAAVRLWWKSRDWTIGLRTRAVAVSALAISADASIVAAGLENGHCQVWAIDREEVVHSHEDTGEVTAIALSADLRHVAVGHAGGEIALWLLAERDVVVRASRLPAAVASLSFTADHRWLCGTSRDGSVVVLELPWLRPAIELRAHSQAARAVIAPGGELIATTSEDGTAAMWRLITGWSTPSQVIDELARRVTPPSLHYPRLDDMLESWRVLSHLRSLPALPREVRQSADSLASRMASWLQANVQPERVTSTAARIRSAHARVLAVDARLAALWS